MKITIEIESPADVHNAVASFAQLAERLGVAVERPVVVPFAETPRGSTAEAAAEPQSGESPRTYEHVEVGVKLGVEPEEPNQQSEEPKQLRGKNAKAAADRMTAAGERDDDYERLPQKWRDHVDNELMPKEAAEAASAHKDEDSDLDPPSPPGDITLEDLKAFGEKVVTSLPQGATQLKVLNRIHTILDEAGAVVDGKPRFKHVPEDRIAAVYAKLLELETETAQGAGQ